jgi:predicted Zn-dependent protease
LLAVVVTLPALVIWSARHLAESAATRLPPELDEKLGRPTWTALEIAGQRCDDPAADRYVQGVLAPLLAALGPTPFHFQLMVVDSAEVNAFALPGGFIVVKSGLLAEARSGEEVAAVLAHELSHVTLRHSTKRLAGGLGVSAALALVLGVVDVGAPAYTLAYLAGLGYERGQESEADEQGQALLLAAGISPIGMATFFERLSGSLHPPELLSTHPDPGDRAERARSAARDFQPRVTVPAPVGVGCGALPK